MIQKDRNFERIIDNLKEKNLNLRLDIRSPHLQHFSIGNEEKDEKKIKLLEAENEFYKKQLKNIENEYKSKIIILEHELAIKMTEFESIHSDIINLKVQLADLTFVKETDAIMNKSLISKLKNYIKKQNEAIANYKKLIK